jgi:hypothetical protein
MSVLTATLRGARAVFAVPAVAASVTVEVAPGFAAVPANASDAQWAAYIGASYNVRAQFSRARRWSKYLCDAAGVSPGRDGGDGAARGWRGGRHKVPAVRRRERARSW